MINLWRITLKPEGSNIDSREFCLNHGILGVGWSIDPEKEIVDWDTYIRVAKEKYKKVNGWWPALNAIGLRMKINDLCWTRDKSVSII